MSKSSEVSDVSEVVSTDERDADPQSETDSKYIRERAGTELVNQKHVDDYDFDIGRDHRGQSHLRSVNKPGEPGCLGNPHPVAEHGECDICDTTHTRAESVERFREDFADRLRTDYEFREWVESLEGKRLACYCVPEHCHGDVILEFLDKGEQALLRWERDQFKERVTELEEQVTKLQRFTGPAIAKFLNDVAQDDDVPSYDEQKIIPIAAKAATTVTERGDRLNSIENTVQRHETEIQNGKAVASDSQGEHWENVVEQAQKVSDMSKHQLPDNWVILYTDDVAKAISPGERRASQLIDEWTDTSSDKYKQGTKKQPYRPPAKSRNGRAQNKAIKIDLDVWGETDD